MKSGYSHILNVSCAEKMEKTGDICITGKTCGQGRKVSGEVHNKGVETILIFRVVAGVHSSQSPQSPVLPYFYGPC